MRQGAAFFDVAFKQGIALYEPMRGLCTGQEVCLHIGIRVNKYLHTYPDGHTRHMVRT